jgi:hypothetical protein
MLAASTTRAQAQNSSLPEAATPASPATPDKPDEAEARITASARRHFHVGVKLYRDTNYQGALAEFEAAYRDKPGPGSLQNVALCLKALFRYAEAAETLRLLLDRHRTELSEPEQRAVEAAIGELASLVGRVFITVKPELAEVNIDGRPIRREELARGVPLNVGEHTVAVEAKGYTRLVEVLRLASQQELRQSFALTPSAGFLDIVAADPKAAIAVDEEPVAYHEWSGPVSADSDHLVQIYRDGFEPFEQTVRVELGKTTHVRATLGAATGAVDEQTPLPSKPSAPPPSRAAIGYYGLLALSVVGVNDAPLGFEVSGTKANMSLPSFGLRGGYRISRTVAIEGVFDFGRLDAKGACQPNPDSNVVESGCWATRDFSLRSLRFGPNLRLMTGGDSLRFAPGIGVGFVSHELKVDPAAGNDVHGPLAGGSASGIDPYFSLELGAAYNYRHLYLELGVIAFIEGARALRGAFDSSAEKAVFENGTLPMLGLTLKAGYSSWAPKR